MRRAILDAATRLFAEDGYRAATTNDIAANVGVAKTQIYKHFRSKEALFSTVLKREERMLEKGVIAPLRMQPATGAYALPDAVDDVLWLIFDFHRARPYALPVLFGPANWRIDESFRRRTVYRLTVAVRSRLRPYFETDDGHGGRRGAQFTATIVVTAALAATEAVFAGRTSMLEAVDVTRRFLSAVTMGEGCDPQRTALNDVPAD